MLRADSTTSGSADVAGFLAFFLSLATTLAAGFVYGSPPLLVCIGLVVALLASRRTRTIGAWALAGVAIGAVVVVGLAAFAAASAPGMQG